MCTRVEEALASRSSNSSQIFDVFSCRLTWRSQLRFECLHLSLVYPFDIIRYAAGAFIGVEYEGCFRLCTVTQIKVNDAGTSSVPALRENLQRELEDIRDDQRSMHFARRPGTAQKQRDSQPSNTSSSSTAANDMNAMDLELMIGILPKKIPESMRQRSNHDVNANNHTGDGVVASLRDVPREHSVVTVSTISMLFTNVGVPGLEGLGSGFVRLLGGVDFFQPDVRLPLNLNVVFVTFQFVW